MYYIPMILIKHSLFYLYTLYIQTINNVMWLWLIRKLNISPEYRSLIFNILTHYNIKICWTSQNMFSSHYQKQFFVLIQRWLSWSWSYCSWIYNYLCNQCLSSLTLWVQIPLMARCTRYNIIVINLSVTFGRSVVFSVYFSPISSTNNTDSHDITEVLLKVALTS